MRSEQGLFIHCTLEALIQMKKAILRMTGKPVCQKGSHGKEGNVWGPGSEAEGCMGMQGRGYICLSAGRANREAGPRQLFFFSSVTIFFYCLFFCYCCFLLFFFPLLLFLRWEYINISSGEMAQWMRVQCHLGDAGLLTRVLDDCTSMCLYSSWGPIY